MRPGTFLLTASLLAATHVAHALPPRPAFQWVPVELNRKLVDACFPSGLRVTVRQDARQPVVSVVTVVDQGAARDPVGQEGTTHLLEHLWFRAAPDGKTTVDERIQRAGARHNAFTYEDVTAYVTEAPTDALPSLLALERDRLVDPLARITTSILDNERAIVRSELALSDDLHMQDLPRLLPRGFFPKGLGATGAPTSAASLAAIGAKALKQVAAQYRPDHTTIQITGDVDPGDVIRRMQELFPQDLLFRAQDGSYPQEGDCAPTPRTPMVEPVPRTPTPMAATTGPVPYPAVLHAWAVPGAYGAEEPLFRTATTLLHSRLVEGIAGDDEAMEERFEPACTYIEGVGASTILCVTRVPTGVDPHKVQARMAQALSNRALSPEEQAFVAQRNRFGHLHTLLGVGALSALHNPDALRDALSNHVSGSPNWYVDASRTYVNTTHVEVAKALSVWLDNDSAVSHVVVPEGMPIATVMGAKGGLSTATRTTAVAEGGASRVVTDLDAGGGHHASRRLLPPRPASTWPTPRMPEVLERVLPSGLRILAMQTHDVPLIHTMIALRGGDATHPAGLDDWVWALTTLDSHGLPTPRDNRIPIRYDHIGALVGASLWTGANEDYRYLGFDGTAGNAAEQLWMLRAAVSQIGVVSGKDEIKRLHATYTEAAASDTPASEAWRQRMGHLLGAGHPYALGKAGRMAAHGDLSPKALAWQQAAVFSPEHATVVVVGGLPAKEALKIAQAQFYDWRPQTTKPVHTKPEVPVSPAPERKIVRIPDPDAHHATVTLTCRTDPAASGATSTVGRDLVRHLIYAALRESEVGSYDPDASFYTWRDLEMLEIRATVRTEAVKPALTSVLDTLSHIATQGPDVRDTQALAHGAASRWLLALSDDDNLQLLLLRHGTNLPQVAKTWPTSLAGVPPADVQAWLAPCIGHESVSVLVPKAAL